MTDYTNLPPEIWTEIFSHLFRFRLKGIETTCKLFYDIINDPINQKRWENPDWSKELPSEIWTEIFMHFSIYELNRVKKTCQLFTDIIENPINEKKWKKVIYTPLNFWFNRDSSLAIPRVSLQYPDVQLEFAYKT